MKKVIGIFSILLMIILASCNLPTQKVTQTSEADAIITAAAKTVAAQLTKGVTMPSPGPTLQVEFTATTGPGGETPEPQPSDTTSPSGPTSTPEVCDRGDFVTDITIDDGTVLSPGEVFTKTWQIRNSGTCTWTTSYSAVFDRDNLMGAETIVSLPHSVAPGETVDVSIEMVAPNTPGTYQGHWMLRNAEGIVFGLGSKAEKSFFVDIEVAVPFFAVTGVTPSVEPGTFEGTCNPAKLVFKADIKVNKGGTVQYHWMFSDAPDSAVFEITFDEAGTKSVSYELELTEAAGEYTGWGAVYNDEPNHQEFGKVSYTLKCQ